jgi:hypothetical protein
MKKKKILPTGKYMISSIDEKKFFHMNYIVNGRYWDDGKEFLSITVFADVVKDRDDND